MRLNHIELFAGCGGLNLGMKKAGFSLLLANELSPMAGETFAFNFLGDNLLDDPQEAKHTFWLGSNYPRSMMSKRLREDPRTYPQNTNSDIPVNPKDLQGSLIIGNINALNDWLQKDKKALKEIKTSFGEGEVDVVSGGPPCQSFSLAGLREKENEKNSLPWSFAKFAELVKPKIVLLENVSGILLPFTDNGKKYYAYFEVAKAFASIGYVPLTLHVNAKFAGVAQNRPRFILIGVRSDFFKRIAPSLNPAEKELFATSLVFFKKIRKGEDVAIHDLAVHDLNKESKDTVNLFKSSFLAPLCVREKAFVTVKEAIQDLESTKPTQSDFVKNLNKTFKTILCQPKGEFDFSHKPSANQDRVRRRFRIYQVMSSIPIEAKRELANVIAEKTSGISDETWQAVKPFSFLSFANKSIKFRTKEEFLSYLAEHHTKKQMQRALIADAPAPAALSIADDACHYKELRTLSAREMARIQSFPDDFIFRSKMTTGGTQRRYEVPIYTQIGNAVPVLLGLALGKALKNLLSKA